jgi:hypothetical protein
VVVKTAGLVGVAVQGDGDLAFMVTDDDGQTLPEGNVDRDLKGSEGTKMVSLLIAEPGTYRRDRYKSGRDVRPDKHQVPGIVECDSPGLG